MALEYVVTKRVFGFDKDKNEKYVAKSVRSGKVNFAKMCRKVSQLCGVHRKVVDLVVSGLVDKMAEDIDDGKSVQLGEFGIFSPTIRAKSADDEKEILRGWVREQIGNKMCFYGKQVFQFNFDPRSMAEDLGDDVVKANTYGLKNLKYVAANFVDWIAVNDEGYAAVESTYKEIIAQFVRFMDHAMVSIGGMYINPKYYGDPEPLYQYVPKAKQVAALKFVLKNLNELQDWIINDKITAIIGPTAKHYVAQAQFFNEMLTRETLGRLQINEVDGKNVFTLDEYLGIIFDEMFTKKTGNLQLADMAFQNSFVENLTGYMDKGEFKSAGSNSLREWLNETTCSCHAYCESRHSFDAVDALGEIVLSPRIDKSNKRPIVMKYLRKTYNTAKSRMDTGNEKTREHYRLLVLKLNYLFD